MNEPVIEKVLRHLRLSRVAPWVKDGDRILDVGCGWEARALRHFSPRLKEGVGLDFKVEQENVPTNLSLLAERFDEKWPLNQAGFDTVLMLAVLEHIEPERVNFVLENIHKSLRIGGKLILTVPTPRGRPVLEFLAFRLGVVNPNEIRDHKLYYDQKLLSATLEKNRFRLVKYQTFQFGMNSFGIAEPVN